jgi:hypothetical protein
MMGSRCTISEGLQCSSLLHVCMCTHITRALQTINGSQEGDELYHGMGQRLLGLAHVAKLDGLLAIIITNRRPYTSKGRTGL